jgi:hypothetical protein
VEKEKHHQATYEVDSRIEQDDDGSAVKVLCSPIASNVFTSPSRPPVTVDQLSEVRTHNSQSASKPLREGPKLKKPLDALETIGSGQDGLVQRKRDRKRNQKSAAIRTLVALNSRVAEERLAK